MSAKSFLFPVLLLLVVSCNRQYVVQHDAYPQTLPNPYCSLLHIPHKPYPPIEQKPYIGIYMLAAAPESTPNPSCIENRFIQVAGIINGSPASKAGLKEKDIILSLNDVPVCDAEDRILAGFRELIEQQPLGAPVKMEILRGDQRLSITVLPETKPYYLQPEATHPASGQCQSEPSVLQRELQTQNLVPLFNNLTDELYIRSNLDHNPDLPYAAKSNRLQLKEVTYTMRHPLSAGEVGKELSYRISDAVQDNRRLLLGIASLLDIEFPASKSPSAVTFPALLQIMNRAKSDIDETLSNLTPEEKVLLQNKSINPWDDSDWNRILDISMKVNRAGLLKALAPLLSFLTVDNLEILKGDVIERFGAGSGPVLYEETTGLGRVIVGGFGPNIYTEDAALILDLGGDDLYLNNAGGTRPGMPLSLVIDWGGTNRYISGKDFSQGAGLLGGGFLFDLGESSIFSSLDGSQGAGFWGLGLLYHAGGKAIYSARKYAQGAGLMGIGMLIGGGDNDRYDCSYGGQGLGLFGGAGLLIDRAGDDSYQLGGLEPDFRDPKKSTVSLGQGFGKGVRPEKEREGAPGGIGMLIDREGNDNYIADYFAQGASYYYGLGILHDLSGNDEYIAGRYAQGAGIHSSAGVLVDMHGNDSYYASLGVSQGMGHDYGIGLLEDISGENFFWGGTLVQGAATNGSIGILIDLPGIGGQKISMSRGQAYAEEKNSIGLMITGDAGSGSPVITIGKKKD